MPLVQLDPDEPLDDASSPPAPLAGPKLVPLDPNEPLDPVTAGQRAGSFATGANDLLATTAGLPVDLVSGALNLGLAGAERGAGALGYNLTLPRISNPIGGSASLRDLLAGTVGRTDPTDALGRILYGAGSATMSVPLMGAGVAGAVGTPAAIGEGLAPATPAALARSTAIAGASGAAGTAGRELVPANNPWAPVADIAGSTLGALATGGALSVPRLAAQLLRPAFATGQQTIAGRLLGQAAGPDMSGDLVQALAAAPQPSGVVPTLGDLTGNRGLQAVQRAVEAGTPEAGARAQAIASQNNQQILDSLSDIGAPGARAPYEFAQQGAQQLEAIRAAQQQAASAAFERVPGGVMVPVDPLRQRYADYATGISQARSRFLPDTYASLLAGYGDQEPLSELQDFRSALQTDARQAAGGANPDYNRANVLNGLHDALFPEGGPEELLAPEAGAAGDALRAARDQWRQYAQTYSTPPAIRAVLRPSAPDSAAFDTLLGSGAGQAERAAQFVSAAQGNPDLLQTARDWFVAKMQQTGSTAAQDQQGSKMLSGYKLGNFVQANQPLIDSDVFDASHRQAIGDAVDAANLVQRTARAGTPGGSDTYRNLATGNYLGSLGMGPLAATLAKAPEIGGGSAGAGLGSYFFGAPGAAIGAPIGAAAGHMLSYAPARANIRDLVNQAVNDPTLAAQLMTRAEMRPPTPRGISLQDVLAATAGAAAAAGTTSGR